MKKFEEFYNRIFFALYSLLYFIRHYVIGPIIEIVFARPFYAIPWVKRRLKDKYGWDYEGWRNAANSHLDDPGKGTMTKPLSGLLAYIDYTPFLLLIIILVIIIGESFHEFVGQNLAIIIIGIGAFALYLSYRFVWKDDRYLDYFKTFKKEGRKPQIVWTLAVLLYIIVSTIAMIYLFRYAEIKLGHWH